MSEDFGLELLNDTTAAAAEPRAVVFKSIPPDCESIAAAQECDQPANRDCSDTFFAATPKFDAPAVAPLVGSGKQVELCILADRSEVKLALASHLDCEPDDIRIAHDDYGKPRVVSHRIHFSISHASGRTLLAISPQRIGVDLDRTHRPIAQAEGLLRYFTEAEREALSAINQPRRSWLIMQCWARKEAFAKATGLGLRIGLDTFSVFEENPAVAKLVGGRTFGWQVMDVSLTGGYAAAVAGPVGFDIRWAGRAAA